MVEQTCKNNILWEHLCCDKLSCNHNHILICELCCTFFYSGRRLPTDQIPDWIKQLGPWCHELFKMIRLLLEQDPVLSEQCAVPTLPAIDMGVVGTVSVPHVTSDSDPEKYLKQYKNLEYFEPPLCGEPDLPNGSVDVLSSEENTEQSSDSSAQSDKSSDTDSEEFVSDNKVFCILCGNK